MPRGRAAVLAQRLLARRREQAAKAADVDAAAAIKRKAIRSLNAAQLLESHKALRDSLSSSQLSKLQRLFAEHGKSEAGFITAKELGPLLKAVGDDPRREELQAMIASVDADGNGVIDFEEFLVLVAVRSQHKHTSEDLTAAFRLFDPDQKGVLPLALFRTVMENLAGVTGPALEDIVSEAIIVSEAEEQRIQDSRRARADAKRRVSVAKAASPVSIDAAHEAEPMDATRQQSVNFAAGSARTEQELVNIYYEPFIKVLFSY